MIGITACRVLKWSRVDECPCRLLEYARQWQPRGASRRDILQETSGSAATYSQLGVQHHHREQDSQNPPTLAMQVETHQDIDVAVDASCRVQMQELRLGRLEIARQGRRKRSDTDFEGYDAEDESEESGTSRLSKRARRSDDMDRTLQMVGMPAQNF